MEDGDLGIGDDLSIEAAFFDPGPAVDQGEKSPFRPSLTVTKGMECEGV